MKLGELIYLCSKSIDANEDISYGTPKMYVTRFSYLTVQPISGQYNTVDYGESLTGGWQIVANLGLFDNVFHEGDKIYLDGKKPLENEPNGKSANGIIKYIQRGNKALVIMVSRIEGY